MFGALSRLGVAVKKALSSWAVGSSEPALAFGFTDNLYRTNNSSASLSQAMTHSRSGNATMTDGFGPELVTNGTFDTDTTGWTLSPAGTHTVSSGVLTIDRDGAGATPYVTQGISTVVGNVYLLSFEVKAGSTDAYSVSLDGVEVIPATSVTTGTKTLTFVASETVTDVALFSRNSIASVLVLDNISVREMPAIKWAPHNLLTYSEDATQQTLVATTSLPNAQSSPDGTLTADKILETATTSAHYLGTYTFSAISGVEYTTGVFAKAAERTVIQSSLSSASGLGGNGYANFDLSSGAVTATGAGVTASMEDYGNGWYLCKTTALYSTTGAAQQAWMIQTSPTAIRGQSYAGDAASGLYLWGWFSHRSDLGGMVNNPERGDSYVPTAARPYGPELVTNGTFDTDLSGWTEVGSSVSTSISDGEVTITSGDGGYDDRIRQTISITPNALYVVTATVRAGTKNARVSVRTGDGLTELAAATVTSTSNQEVTLTFSTSASSIRLEFLVWDAAAGTMVVDSVSIKQSSVNPAAARYMPRVGHHVYNGTSWANEGYLHESESRTNLVTYSNDITAGTGWVKNGTTFIEDDTASPSGEVTGIKLTSASATSATGIYYTVSSSAGSSLSVYVKAGTTSIVFIQANTSDQYVAYDLSTQTLLASSGCTPSIEDVGNGWYRITAGNTTASGSYCIVGGKDTYTSGSPWANGTWTVGNYIYIYGAQLEAASTPSSYIPTSGSTVTRAADSIVIPSANLPWPQPEVIGDELVTNGDFGTGDLSGWTVTGTDGTHTVTYSSGGARYQSDTTSPLLTLVQGSILTIGKVYSVTVETTAYTSGSLKTDSFSGTNIVSSGLGTVTFYGVASSAAFTIVRNSTNVDVTLDNISVREINPLSVSIQMDGRMTYADTGTIAEVYFYRRINGGEYANAWLDTSSTKTGQVLFEQRDGTTYDSVTSGSTAYSPGVLVPYNIASRHGSTFINGAVDGTALTANTTPVALPDLSATDLELGYDYMGTINQFRVWSQDLGDTGIVEATEPSLEPSLSLTFDGSGSSFIVEDWT